MICVPNDQDAAIRVIREVIAPLVRADRGELYLTLAQDGSIHLHLAGRYSGCPGNTLVCRRVITPALRSAAPSVEVSITSGALIPPGAELLR